MLTAKGLEELQGLLESPLVDDWDAAEQSIRQVLRLLASQRPDLLRLYFTPAFLDALEDQPTRTRLNAMAAALRTGVVDLAGRPAVTHQAQAQFYLRCFQDDLTAAVRSWRHPDAATPMISETPASSSPTPPARTHPKDRSTDGAS